MPVMAERIRITFDVPEEIRRALNIEASSNGKSVGELIEHLVREHCQESLSFAINVMQRGGTAGEPKKGRPRKSSSD